MELTFVKYFVLELNATLMNELLDTQFGRVPSFRNPFRGLSQDAGVSILVNCRMNLTHVRHVGRKVATPGVGAVRHYVSGLCRSKGYALAHLRMQLDNALIQIATAMM